MNNHMLDHVGIVVTDLEATAKFYTDVLGFAQKYRETLPERGAEVIGLSAGDETIELIKPLDENSAAARYRGDEPAKLYHLSFRVDDLSSELKRLKDAGLRLVDEQPKRGANGIRGAFLHPKSTGDVLIELCQR